MISLDADGRNRVLLELGASEDPVWAYFDSQHKYIVHQMGQSYRTATALIRGTSHSYRLLRRINRLLGAKDRTAPVVEGPDALNSILAQQLHTYFAALETKQSESLIGSLSIFSI